MYITNNPELARYAVEAGVDRIFVDLEIMGKYERQGHKDTLISHHTMDDLRRMREYLPDVTILTRINPFYAGTETEIEEVLSHKPQMVMLPMYKTAQEVKKVSKIIGGRCELIPLLETKEALECVDEVCQIEGVSELYVGLNDLHLALKLDFMFELLANGTIEKISKRAHFFEKKFGFGGVARLNEGLLKAEYILGEHVRLQSNSVILSRTFHRQHGSVEELGNTVDFRHELNKIKDYIETVYRWSPENYESNRLNLMSVTQKITEILKSKES